MASSYQILHHYEVLAVGFRGKRLYFRSLIVANPMCGLLQISLRQEIWACCFGPHARQKYCNCIPYDDEKQYCLHFRPLFLNQNSQFGILNPSQSCIDIINKFITNYNTMLETDHEQFVEPEYPAFPVVFQRDLEGEFDSGFNAQQPQNKKAPTVPQQDASSLFRLSEKVYETKYPSLFNEPIPNDRNSLQNFFKNYLPIDQSFVQQMKANIDSLSIVRLGANKIYIGQVNKSKCNGKSIIIFKNGNLFEGEMIENKRHGKGAFIQPNLGWYIGDFQEDHKHGEGLEILYHKCAYKGQFCNGLKHDRGLQVDEDGNIYEGIWKLGIMHGKGILKSKKSTYNGQFVNWLKHGTGEQHFVNGDIYRGEYQNGRFDGIGSYQWKSEGAFYEGNFKNGLRHGKGKWQKEETKYNGGYGQGLKQGYGELYFPSGNFYKGNFIQDKKQGYGQMFWTDGSFYKGEWKNGTQHGKGQIYLAGGDIVSGIFQKSILVQAMPSIYEKQMEISNLSIQDLFGNKKGFETSTRPRTFSETKGFQQRKRLARIEQTAANRSNKKQAGNIAGKIYFKSPEKSDHSDGGCGTCTRRLENFRLKQQHKRVHNHSIRQHSRHDEL